MFCKASMTVWPSGLRRWLKAPFRKGVGSNPTAVNKGEQGAQGGQGLAQGFGNLKASPTQVTLPRLSLPMAATTSGP